MYLGYSYYLSKTSFNTLMVFYLLCPGRTLTVVKSGRNVTTTSFVGHPSNKIVVVSQLYFGLLRNFPGTELFACPSLREFPGSILEKTSLLQTLIDGFFNGTV